MPDASDRRYALSRDFVCRKIAGETLLVPVANRVADGNELFVLNETGARVWELAGEGRCAGEIKSRLLEEFDAAPEQVEQDLTRLLGELESVGALEPAPPARGAA